MNLLRRMSTLRLIAVCATVTAIALAAGIAVARGRSGPKPPPRPLAQAIHSALVAKPVSGLSARITFTNHLFPTGSLGTGSGSALLNGANGRLWISNDGRFRLELQSDTGDTQIMGDGNSLRVYDASSNSEYLLPLSHSASARGATASHHGGVPTVAEIRKGLARLVQAANLTGAVPGDIAGRPVYSVRISPRHDGGLLGGVQLAWDAQHGVPLKIAIYSRGDSSPVLALTATDVRFGSVSAADLSVRPPSSTKVTTVTLPSTASRPRGRHGPAVTGVAAVARRVPFHLAAPASLVGLPRKLVRLVDAGGHTSAVLIYGQGLGAIVVLEQQHDSGSAGGGGPLAALPAVSINGASGRELATALGTLLRFDRGGVSYTLIGSVPAVAAEAAARALS
jgi:outer membrane lipoprotein-sorting protein